MAKSRRSKRKPKTHKGAAKRFKLTGSGKFVRRHSFARHILTSKSSRRKRRLGKDAPVSSADRAAVRAMLPYGP